MKKSAFLFLILFASISQAFSQEIFDPPRLRPEFKAIYTSEAIELDGKLEDIWKSAVVIDGMFMKRPRQNEAASERTLIRVLWDENFLYVAGVMYDSHANDKGFTTTQINRDFDFQSGDLFGVALDGLMDRRNAVVLQVNPYGAIRDLQSYDDRSFNRDWNALWYAKTSRTDTAWVAEIAIPWESLRYKKGTDRIGIIFNRNIRRNFEENTLPAVPRTFTPYRMNYAADLVGINPPIPDINLQFNPYTLGSLDQSVGPILDQTNRNMEIGGELKWAVNSNALLDITVNTDFAQADIDQQVVNLTRFNVLFPERRQFFLENADLFSVSGTDFFQPFFSRTIGLDNTAGAIPIHAGARLVRRGADWNAGAIFISQDGTDRTNSSQFGVLRYSKNLRQQDQIGIMATYRRDAIDALIGSSGSANQTNYSLSVDGLVRFNQQVFLQAFASMTDDTEAGQDYAARASFNVQTNQVEGGMNLNYVGRNYLPAMGFLGTDNFINLNPFINFDIRPAWLPSGWRRIIPNFQYELMIDATTQQSDQAFLNINPIGFQLDSGTDFGIGVSYEWQYLNTGFSPLGIEIAPADYLMRSYGFGFNRNDTETVDVDFEISYGDYYNGKNLAYSFGVQYQFQPFFRLGASFNRNDIRGLGIKEQDAVTDLYSISSRLALNPRFNINAFYQRNAYIDQNNLNIRLSWEYQPLSFLFVVLNENNLGINDPLVRNQRQIDRQAIAKLTWMKQF